MDFFIEQDKARTKTGRLVALFILAVALVILSVYAAIMGVIQYTSTDPGIDFYDPGLFLAIAGATFGVICMGSMIKIAALSKGGGYVAESLGGTRVGPSTEDPDQRKLINVVEEMAIASGTPVPPVYLLENEESINAFAAGFSPNDAVIGVTRGCCQRLSREELQGVIAHEFSHILNGDMRLNIRLMGFLGGIMVIATIGQTILRVGRHRTPSSGKNGKGGGQMVIIAVLLLIIGYVGVLIGRLIQSTLSRQREYLADASAVQFTRSTGIVGALKKIGGFASGSKIESPAAGEACHMFFGKAVRSLFATHPPLVDRIRKIEPGFNGDFSTVDNASKAGDLDGPSSLSEMDPGRRFSIEPATVMKNIGNITPESVTYSAAVLAAIPEAIKNETRDTLGAYALVCVLLLEKDPVVKRKQLDLLQGSAPLPVLRQIERVDQVMKDIHPELRLPILDLAIPSLRQMSSAQFTGFQDHVKRLMEADSRITLFEFVLQSVITHRLEAAFVHTDRKILFKNITPLAEDIMALLSVLALSGHQDRLVARKAFQAGVAALPIIRENRELEVDVSFDRLQKAMERISSASFGVKKAVFDACCQCVLFDGRVAVDEAELLRAVAYAVDIPLPPMMAMASSGQPSRPGLFQTQQASAF
jgi:Zn-dependent protease with chaperone function